MLPAGAPSPPRCESNSSTQDGKTIVFTYKRNLYHVPAEGGTAVQLTTHEAEDVRPGMVIESVDGQPIAADKDLSQHLNRKAGKRVLLSVVDGDRKREMVVKQATSAEEVRLLYARWVRRNQEEVDRGPDLRLFAWTESITEENGP